MSTTPTPPARRRAPAPVVVKVGPQIEGLDIVGGPAAAKLGRPIFSEGKSMRQWPFVTGTKLIGLALDEHRAKDGKTIWYVDANSRFVHTHFWVANRATGKMTYRGTASSRERAKAQMENVQPVAAVTNMQPIEVDEKKAAHIGTPPPRRRSTSKAA